MITRWAFVSGLGTAASAFVPAQAADYPSGPVTIIVAQAAGGSLDVILRIAAGQLSNAWKQQVSHHTIPSEAGRVFAQARPKQAVYTHFILRSTAPVPAPTLDDVISQTRQTYDGPVELGEDLMSFEIGDDVVVRRFNGSKS